MSQGNREWFERRALAANQAIETFNDDAEERAIAWAQDEMTRHQGRVTMNVMAEKLKKYNFMDDHGHPLEHCVDYHTLLEMADYAMHIHVNNNEDDTCALCGHDIQHPIHHILR